ncbi:prepilin-type N-terminal cleavage/methylation domain-containing protein, partial [bacterium]|nr:prepilin-type N-terminal cleavage/methylation domain-containing protein [bacterium]
MRFDKRQVFIKGVTFIELMISLVVLSILAFLALPLQENDVQRDKEVQLKR